MKNLETANKGIKALAKKEPSLVENRFGYDVPGYMYGGIARFQFGGPAGGFNIDQDYIRRYYEDTIVSCANFYIKKITQNRLV